jgi:hypothetical protein
MLRLNFCAAELYGQMVLCSLCLVIFKSSCDQCCTIHQLVLCQFCRLERQKPRCNILEQKCTITGMLHLYDTKSKVIAIKGRGGL